MQLLFLTKWLFQLVVAYKFQVFPFLEVILINYDPIERDDESRKSKSG